MTPTPVRMEKRCICSAAPVSAPTPAHHVRNGWKADDLGVALMPLVRSDAP